MADPQIPGTPAHTAAVDQELAELRAYLTTLSEAYHVLAAKVGAQSALGAISTKLEQSIAASTPPGVPVLSGWFVAAIAVGNRPAGCACGVHP